MGSDADRPIYLEIKSTTWAQGQLVLFPDTETTRGQKHLRELTALLPQARAVMLYFINREIVRSLPQEILPIQSMASCYEQRSPSV